MGKVHCRTEDNQDPPESRKSLAGLARERRHQRISNPRKKFSTPFAIAAVDPKSLGRRPPIGFVLLASCRCCGWRQWRQIRATAAGGCATSWCFGRGYRRGRWPCSRTIPIPITVYAVCVPRDGSFGATAYTSCSRRTWPTGVYSSRAVATYGIALFTPTGCTNRQRQKNGNSNCDVSLN